MNDLPNSPRIPLTADQRTRLEALPAANIGDVMERLGVMHSAISSVWVGARIVGPAVTVLTAAGDNKIVHTAMDAAEAGEVVVINGFSDDTRALIGDLIGEKAHALGIAGFVIDGCVRDVDALAEIPLPVFARGVSPAGPYKNGPGHIGRPVAVGGVAVVTGDIVVGDADGVVVIPRAELDDVIERAEQKFRDELVKRQSIRADSLRRSV